MIDDTKYLKLRKQQLPWQRQNENATVSEAA